ITHRQSGGSSMEENCWSSIRYARRTTCAATSGSSPTSPRSSSRRAFAEGPSRSRKRRVGREPTAATTAPPAMPSSAPTRRRAPSTGVPDTSGATKSETKKAGNSPGRKPRSAPWSGGCRKTNAAYRRKDGRGGSVKGPPFGDGAAWRLRPAVALPQHLGHSPEGVAVDDRALAAERVLRQFEQAVQPDVGGPSRAVAGARAEQQPVLLLPVVGFLAGEHQRVQHVALAAHHQQGAVLAQGRVLLEGHPGPHDLA